MVRVATIGRVTERGSPTNMRSANAPAAAFASQGDEFLGAVGGAMEKVGNAMLVRSLKNSNALAKAREKEEAAIRTNNVLKAEASYKVKMQGLQNAVMEAEVNRDSTEILGTYQQATEGNMKESLKEFKGDPYSEKLFRERTMGFNTSSANKVAAKELLNIKKYQKDVAYATIQAETALAVNNVYDNKAIKEHALKIERTVAGMNVGKTPVVRRQLIDEGKQKFYSDVLQSLITKEDAKQSDYFVKNYGNLLGPQGPVLKAKVKALTSEARIDGFVEATAGQDWEDTEKQVRKTFSGKEEEEALSRAKKRKESDDYVKKVTTNRWMNGEYDKLLENPAAYRVPKNKGKLGIDLHHLKHRLITQNSAKEKAVASDKGTLEELHEMSQAELANTDLGKYADKLSISDFKSQLKRRTDARYFKTTQNRNDFVQDSLLAGIDKKTEGAKRSNITTLFDRMLRGYDKDLQEKPETWNEIKKEIYMNINYDSITKFDKPNWEHLRSEKRVNVRRVTKSGKTVRYSVLKGTPDRPTDIGLSSKAVWVDRLYPSGRHVKGWYDPKHKTLTTQSGHKVPVKEAR